MMLCRSQSYKTNKPREGLVDVMKGKALNNPYRISY
jgi:hypothetical protein